MESQTNVAPREHRGCIGGAAREHNSKKQAFIVKIAMEFALLSSSNLINASRSVVLVRKA